jgi:protoporphyrinogen/coproporphyrinogen III oxidase
MKHIIGKLTPSERQVTIWGAGFSGLVLGYYLKQQGYRITIYERSNRVGGKIQTKKTAYGLAEAAAHALYLNPDGLELLKELKLDPVPAQKKLKKLVLINGKPRRPYQFQVLAKLAFNAVKKPPLVSDGLTVAEFFRPLLGQEIIHHFLTPAMSGIYATPAENLHFKSIFHMVSGKAQFDSYWEFIRNLRKSLKSEPKPELSGSVTFEGGMQGLINRLAEVLKPDIKLNYKEHFRIKGNTVVCTDALSAAELISEVRPEFAIDLKRIRYQELSSTTVFLKREIRALSKSFGVVIPLEMNYHSIGVINNKAIFPINNSNVFSYTLISRKKTTEEEIHHDLKLLYPEFVPEDVEHMDVNHWEKAIPIYDLQRYLSVKKLHQLARKEENFAIFGNYVAGLSLREMITAAKTFAKEPHNPEVL